MDLEKINADLNEDVSYNRFFILSLVLNFFFLFIFIFQNTKLRKDNKDYINNTIPRPSFVQYSKTTIPNRRQHQVVVLFSPFISLIFPNYVRPSFHAVSLLSVSEATPSSITEFCFILICFSNKFIANLLHPDVKGKGLFFQDSNSRQVFNYAFLIDASSLSVTFGPRLSDN